MIEEEYKWRKIYIYIRIIMNADKKVVCVSESICT